MCIHVFGFFLAFMCPSQRYGVSKLRWPDALISRLFSLEHGAASQATSSRHIRLQGGRRTAADSQPECNNPFGV